MKITWTAREWNAVAQRLVDNGVDPDRHGWRGELVGAMKAMLPAYRWRDTANLSTAKDILKPLMKELAQREAAAPGPVIATPPDPPKPTAETLSTEDLLVELARRLARMLEAPRIIYGANPPKTDFNSGFFHPPKHNPSPVSEDKQRKFRVLVAGPNADLSHELERRFPNLDLRFVGFQDNPSRAADKARGCDRALLLTKFINHSTADAIKNSGVTYSSVTGAREAREWLSTL